MIEYGTDYTNDGEPIDGAEHGPRLTPATAQCLAGVTPEHVTWLWPRRLPLGKLVVVDGDPSTGKSTLTLDLAARVSTGKAWPDGAHNSGPAGVLLMSAEDGLADTIAPRLIAAGADLHQIHALTELTVYDDNGNSDTVPPALPRDIGAIESLVVKHKVRLVVVDVLMAYLAGSVDSHRDQDVRAALHRLAAMGERTDCTILLVRHLNKAGGRNALYRGGGSIGIVGAARAGYLVARDPDDADRRIFAVTKCNLAVEPPALAYRLISDLDNDCARVEWEDAPVEYTAASLLADNNGDEDESTERDEAADWLRAYLADKHGEAPRKEVIRAAKSEGFSERTLDRARRKAGVTTDRSGYPAVAVWQLAPVPPVGPPPPTHILGGATEASGATGLELHKREDDSVADHQLRQLRHPVLCGPTGEPTTSHAPAEDHDADLVAVAGEWA